MNVSTRGRLDLKSYFQKNDIPTESNFADLIDGMLNEKDDGLVRMPGDPLSIEQLFTAPPRARRSCSTSTTASTTRRRLVPQLDPAVHTGHSAVPGFTISDGAGTVRLFIDRETGFVGIGTTARSPPGCRWAGPDRPRRGRLGLRSISFARDTTEDEVNAGKIAYKGSLGTQALSMVGAGKSVGTRAIKMWDNVEVAGNVVVGGTLAVGGTLTSVLNTLSVKNGQNEFSYNGESDVVLKNSARADSKGSTAAGPSPTTLITLSRSISLTTSRAESISAEGSQSPKVSSRAAAWRAAYRSRRTWGFAPCRRTSLSVSSRTMAPFTFSRTRRLVLTPLFRKRSRRSVSTAH